MGMPLYTRLSARVVAYHAACCGLGLTVTLARVNPDECTLTPQRMHKLCHFGTGLAFHGH